MKAILLFLVASIVRTLQWKRFQIASASMKFTSKISSQSENVDIIRENLLKLKENQPASDILRNEKIAMLNDEVIRLSTVPQNVVLSRTAEPTTNQGRISLPKIIVKAALVILSKFIKFWTTFIYAPLASVVSKFLP